MTIEFPCPRCGVPIPFEPVDREPSAPAGGMTVHVAQVTPEGMAHLRECLANNPLTAHVEAITKRLDDVDKARQAASIKNQRSAELVMGLAVNGSQDDVRPLLAALQAADAWVARNAAPHMLANFRDTVHAVLHSERTPT